MSDAREALLQTRGLNLGSGPHYAEGWVNVDLYDPPEGCHKPDVYADVFHLTDCFPEGSFVACYLGHFLEHLVWDQIPDALAQVRRVCQPGAPVVAVGPCLWKAVQTRQPMSLLEAIVADPRQEPTGHGHAWTPTTETTLEAMVLGGFPDAFVVPVVSISKPDWPNPSTAAWQVAVQAKVP